MRVRRGRQYRRTAAATEIDSQLTSEIEVSPVVDRAQATLQPTNNPAGSVDHEDKSVTAKSNVPHELQLSSAGVPGLLAHNRRAYAKQDWCHPITLSGIESLANETERAHWLPIALAPAEN